MCDIFCQFHSSVECIFPADRLVLQLAGIPAGFYLKGPGMVAPCPKGEYKVGQGAAAACTKCAKGVTTATEASGSIDACNGE